MLLHWFIGAALVGQIAFGFLLDEIAARGTPARGAVINLHKSMGIVLGLLILARIAWRLRHPPPPWPETMAAWERRAADIGHKALYGCMVLMPLSGYLASNFSRHGVRFFGTAFKPWGADIPALYSALNGLHVTTAWVFSLLIAGHLLATLKHAFVDRRAEFSRMWPWGNSPPRAPRT